MKAGCSVTIIDDDVSYLEEMTELLTDCNCTKISTFTNPEKFLENQIQAELFILDLDLNNTINGFMILAEIRRNHPDRPVFVISGYITDQEKSWLLQAGATRIFKKPFEIDEFKKLLEVQANGSINC